jgi:hypothetical protein
MSLSSLRGAAGFASTALDTARSTWKAMADAAVNPENDGSGAAPAVPAVATAPAESTADQSAEPTARKGIRRGVALDAYA